MNKNKETNKKNQRINAIEHSLSVRDRYEILHSVFPRRFIPCAFHPLHRERECGSLKYRIYGCCGFLIVPRDARVWSQIITVLSINLKMLLIIITSNPQSHVLMHLGYLTFIILLSMCWLLKLLHLLLLFRMQNSYRMPCRVRHVSDVLFRSVCSFFSLVKKATNILWTSSFSNTHCVFFLLVCSMPVSISWNKLPVARFRRKKNDVECWNHFLFSVFFRPRSAT